ncbi:MAG: NAD(P)H-hydrate epimerase [Pelolinea sp.]|nr:NAD(P)H-hydrate epimerase [Pelolinea sp.]
MKKFQIPAVTRLQMVEVDRLMIEEYGISLLQMMENAGRDLAQLAREMLGGDLQRKRIAVLCGGGNNGGGGMAAARHLVNRGAYVKVALAALDSKLKETVADQLHPLRAMGVPITEEFPVGDFDLVIDALIGYGLQGAPRGKIAQWIDLANKSAIPILSLDIPSGLDADSGLALGVCIKADTTLTLALPKVGLLKDEASEFVGTLYVGDISVPTSLIHGIGMNIPPLFSDNSIIKIDYNPYKDDQKV